MRAAEAAYLGFAAFFKLERITGRVAECVADMNTAGNALRFHARGHVHGIPPQIIGNARTADHARNRGAGMDADAQPQATGASAASTVARAAPDGSPFLYAASNAQVVGQLLAMSVLSLVPTFEVFLIFQRRLVEGIATSGLKG